jgi:hypothetical protein
VVRRPDVSSRVDSNRRLDRVYAILFGRPPFDREREIASEVLAADPAGGWPRLAHALLMTNEFLFVD